MVVVKVLLSVRALCLGAVRMTYLLVTKPGMSMSGSVQHQHVQAFGDTKRGDTHAGLLLCITVGAKWLCRLKGITGKKKNKDIYSRQK